VEYSLNASAPQLGGLKIGCYLAYENIEAVTLCDFIEERSGIMCKTLWDLDLNTSREYLSYGIYTVILFTAPREAASGL
jgi:hypothetical protein